MHANAAETLLPYIPAPPTQPGRTTRILDIGSGSGYLTHLLAELGGAHSRVVGVEHITELRHLGERNVARSDEGHRLLADGRLRFVVGDGRKGWLDPDLPDGEEPGWDVIHVGAAAAKVHDELVAQLRKPGR
jgi:protein-L-isoaspartate(D-aspartate) O-methyltransferase